MEILSTIAILSCFASPALLIFGFYMIYLYAVQKSKLEAYRKHFENKISVISSTAQNAVRETWFNEIQNHDYSSELEVESKFVYPLMRHLGYSPADLRMRVSVEVRVGRQPVTGIADWVVYREGKPIIVIEAKEKRQDLNSLVQDQARSYCFALNCPSYVLTNGRQVQVFRRGVDSDIMVFSSLTSDLPSKWPDLHRLIGLSS